MDLKNRLRIAGLSSLCSLALSTGCVRGPDVVVNDNGRELTVTDYRPEKQPKVEGQVWFDRIIYRDTNRNGTLDKIIYVHCKERPGSLGLDEDCFFDETALLDNNYLGGYLTRRGNGTYSELGKRSPEGIILQKEFDGLKLKYSR